MNKFLLSICLFSFILLIIFIKSHRNPVINYEFLEKSDILEEINSNLVEIKKIKAELRIKQYFSSVSGFIIYEKQNNFRMELKNELEVGCNDNYFWFWSKRFDKKNLYFCKLEDLEKTRLRKIFFPQILYGLLSVNEIKDYKEIKTDNKQIFVYQDLEINNEKLLKVIIIKDKSIVGYNLYQEDLVIKIDFLELVEIKNVYLPTKIRINWIEENIVQYWEISNYIINDKYQTNWDMPKYKNKINIKNY